MADLGRRMYSQNIVLRGRLGNIDWRVLMRTCIEAMGMKPGGAAASWFYPTDDGKGGEGATICQPMTDSFMVVDTWPDHDGAYLHISSCVRFDVSALLAPIHRAGLAIEFVGALEDLRL